MKTQTERLLFNLNLHGSIQHSVDYCKLIYHESKTGETVDLRDTTGRDYRKIQRIDRDKVFNWLQKIGRKYGFDLTNSRTSDYESGNNGQVFYFKKL